MEMPICTSHVLIHMHCYRLFLGRKRPATHTCIHLIHIYVYIYGSKRIMEMQICTSYVLNTRALLSAVFRQKESCHPYWGILNIYIYGSKRIMEMQICTSHVLKTHALLFRCLGTVCGKKASVRILKGAVSGGGSRSVK